ncbi:2-C-methyl-D-erythritol 4-phosphate cytidylyltransferase [Alteromonas facilis]|uniref:2-C-methyl-D-erythritol 4-phosphate cytidylyltransferase n=1 Tax=Alteromonas facilis TaxID=2048004 RepID=UPI000C28B01D|nr:2-C-methyl-D-erythritol 4-phosphate cytidylyltransferase [Alteromonas facilis]
MAEQFPVIIPAAGVGKRMQADRPKQYLLINGKPILEHTLMRLLTHPQVSDIYLVVSDDDGYIDTIPSLSNARITRVSGGKERVDSVLNGLKALRRNNNNTSWVLVHDAARPCVTHADISRLISTVIVTDNGAILACPVRDTMKQSSKASPNMIESTQPREHLWHALTPQMFLQNELLDAIEKALGENLPVTDEASAMELSGYPVTLVEGCTSNIKVTNPPDLALAEFYLSQQMPTEQR